MGGASLLAAHAVTAPLARTLLEAAGALFALYLLVMVSLSAIGLAMRRRSAGHVPHHAVGRMPGMPEPPAGNAP